MASAALLRCAFKRNGVTARALRTMARETERENIAVVQAILALADARRPRADVPPRTDLIQYVRDRPGHGRRYAIDASKI